jgi:NADPH:quinone reductase
MMKATVAREPGGPGVLQITEIARPVAAAGELLVRVQAAGVNRPDVLQRQGHYPPPPGASPLIGLEVAGEVVEIGAGGGGGGGGGKGGEGGG